MKTLLLTRGGAAAALLLTLCVLFSGCELLGLSAATYTVSFGPGPEGIGSVPVPRPIKAGTNIILPGQGGLTPIDYTYTFGGWMAPNGQTYQAGASYLVNSNTHFRAVWNYATYSMSAPSWVNARGWAYGIEVDWELVNNADYYEVYRGKSPLGTGKEIVGSFLYSPPFLDTADRLIPYTTYYYWVRAVNSYGSSFDSTYDYAMLNDGY